MAQYVFAEIYVVTLGVVFAIFKRCGSVCLTLFLPSRIRKGGCANLPWDVKGTALHARPYDLEQEDAQHLHASSLQ